MAPVAIVSQQSDGGTDGGDDDSVSVVESELLICLAAKAGARSDGRNKRNRRMALPLFPMRMERGEEEQGSSYSLVPLVYFFNGCRTLALDKPLYFGTE